MLGRLRDKWNETAEVYGRMMQRNARCIALLNNGGGTAADFMRADFGTTQPNGLDITASPDFDIKFSKDRLTSNLAYVPNGEFNSIILNPRYISPLALKVTAVGSFLTGNLPLMYVGTIGHEFTHTLQNFKDESGWINSNDSLYPNIQSEGNFVQKNIVSLKRIILDRFVGHYKDYHLNNHEIQARLHEVMAQCYTQWQNLPENKTELWAALHSAGVKTPQFVKDILYDTEEGREALTKFKLYQGVQQLIAKKVEELNDIQLYIHSQDANEDLWLGHLPMIYGELIEHYGDTLGRARMDLGINPAPIINILHEAELYFDKQENPLDEAIIEKLALKIPPELAAAFINNVIELNTEWDDEFTENTLETYYKISEKLVQRPEVKAVLFEPDHLISRNFSDTNTMPPHLNALFNSDYRMFDLMMENGANIEQSYSFIDCKGNDLGKNDIHSLRENWQNVLDNNRDEAPATNGITGLFSRLTGRFNNSYVFTEEDIQRINKRLEKTGHHLNLHHSATPMKEVQAFDFVAE